MRLTRNPLPIPIWVHAHGHDWVALANEFGFLSIVVTNMQVDSRIWNAAGVAILPKDRFPDFRLDTISPDQHITRCLCPILENSRYSGFVVIIRDFIECFVVLQGEIKISSMQKLQPRRQACYVH